MQVARHNIINDEHGMKHGVFQTFVEITRELITFQSKVRKRLKRYTYNTHWKRLEDNV